MGAHYRAELITRILLNVILFTGVFVTPWWFVLVVALLLAAHYTAYEILIAGVLLDTVYGATGAFAVFGVPLIFTLVTAAVFLAAHYIKHHLIFYEE